MRHNKMQYRCVDVARPVYHLISSRLARFPYRLLKLCASQLPYIKSLRIVNDCLEIILLTYLLTYCLGSFSILVKDPNHASQQMFEYDVGVGCPVSFSVDFVIPTSGRDVYDKTMLVNIVDFYRTIRLTVFRPARNLTTTATFGMIGVSYSMQHLSYTSRFVRTESCVRPPFSGVLKCGHINFCTKHCRKQQIIVILIVK